MELKEDSIKITNTYIPGVSREFTLKKLKTRLAELNSSKPEEESKENDLIVQIGIADAKIRNKKYKELILAMGIDKLENEDIFQQVNEHLFGSPEVRDENSLSTFKYSKIVEVFEENTKKLIMQKYADGWSIKSLSSLFDVWETTIRKVIQEGKFIKMKTI